jgi:hypothetical protein
MTFAHVPTEGVAGALIALLSFCSMATAHTYSAGNSAEIVHRLRHAKAMMQQPAPKSTYPETKVRSRERMRCVGGYTWSPTPANGATLPLPCSQSH